MYFICVVYVFCMCMFCGLHVCGFTDVSIRYGLDPWVDLRPDHVGKKLGTAACIRTVTLVKLW